MDDILNCPVCKTKFKNKNQTISKIPLIVRTCSEPDHVVQTFCYENKIHLMRITYGPNYSYIISLNFLESLTDIKLYKDSSLKFNISVSKIIEPDFPNLERFKEKIDFYVAYI